MNHTIYITPHIYRSSPQSIRNAVEGETLIGLKQTRRGWCRLVEPVALTAYRLCRRFPPACRRRVSSSVSHAFFLELRILQSSETWREAVARSRYDTECPLSVGSRTIDYSDGGYGVTIVGSNVTAAGTGQSWRNRYLEVRGHGSGAVIIPFVGESILFERHYRVATDEFSWELPRGFGEPDETDAETARRELREETGLLADDVTVISRLHADAGIMNDDIAVVATRSGSIDYLTPEHSWESMGFALVPVAELDDFIAEAGVNDAITLAALRLLVTMSAAKIRPISREMRHEDGPYGDTVYEKPTFDELDGFVADGGIDEGVHVTGTSADPSDEAYAANPGDDIISKFDAASQSLDDLSAALKDDDPADEYTFDIDDEDDGDGADTGFGYIDGDDDDDDDEGYKTVIDTDGDGLPDTLADIDYGDSIGDGSDSDGQSDDDFDFDGDRGDPLGYRFDVDDEQPPVPAGIGGWDADIDDIDDDDAAYEALFGEPRRSGDDVDRHTDTAEPQVDEPVATAAAESHESSRAERQADPIDDEEDYLEGDDDDAPADIETGNDPILDDEESDRLKNLIAEFSARHAGEIPDGSEPGAEGKPKTVVDEGAGVHGGDITADGNEPDAEKGDSAEREQNDAGGADGEAAGDTGMNGIDDAASAESDTDDGSEPKTAAGTAEGGTEDDAPVDAESDADGGTIDDAEGGETGESNPGDSDPDDDSPDNGDDGDDDADDGWDDDEDEEDGPDGNADDEPAQPLPPMWATEVVTSSTAKPEQIGDVVKYLANGDRSKVGRLIVNFGRREFFIKPIDPDERVMRLASGNVARICDGGLVDFDSDEYEQRLKELIRTMTGGRKPEESAEAAPEKDKKAQGNDGDDAAAPSAPGDEKGGKPDKADGDKPDVKSDDEEDDGDDIFNSILEDIDADGLNGIGDMDELFDSRDAEAGSGDPDTDIDVMPEDMDDMF